MRRAMRVSGIAGSVVVVAVLSLFLPGKDRATGVCTLDPSLPLSAIGPTVSGSEPGSLVERIGTATSGATIRIEPGRYRVANPVVIWEDSVRIVGRGYDRTRIVPTRPGCSLFVVLGSDVVIDSLGMDMSPGEGMGGSAGIGVEIGPAVERCLLRGLEISKAGASGIHGAQVSGCRIEGSWIHDSGDDGIFLRGSDFVIVNNTITRYFDEAIDVAGSGELVVADNRAWGGRIGIVLGGGDVIEVTENVVSDNLQGSLHIQGGGGVVVVDSNHVSPDGGNAIVVRGASELHMVDNWAWGGADLGFEVEAVGAGAVEGNVASAVGVGYRIGEIGSTELGGNGVCAPPPERPVEFVGEGAASGNAEAGISELPPGDPRCADPLGAAPLAAPRLLVQGDSALAMADSLANYLRWVNPGYLSVGVSGDSVWTEVDRDLRDVLLATRGNAIGIVRTAFLYGVRPGLPRVPFPRWHVFYEDELVAVVVPRIGGGRMVARFADGDGEIALRDRVGLWRSIGDHQARRIWRAVPPFWLIAFRKGGA